jgi:transcriptional regulator with XRE-family HTH domain
VGMVKASARTKEQGKRLRALRERLGVSKSRIMDVLSFETSQAYDLYERGVSVIRMDRVPEWAEAFGISEQEFVDAVLGLPARVLPDAVPDDWSLERELRSAGCADWYVKRWVDNTSELPRDVQRAFAEHLIEGWREDEAKRAADEQRRRGA